MKIYLVKTMPFGFVGIDDYLKYIPHLEIRSACIFTDQSEATDVAEKYHGEVIPFDQEVSR